MIATLVRRFVELDQSAPEALPILGAAHAIRVRWPDERNGKPARSFAACPPAPTSIANESTGTSQIRYARKVGRIHPHLGDIVGDEKLYLAPGRQMPTLAAALVVQARQRSGLSQAELARRAGTSRTALSAIEHGKRDPGLERLQKILRAAGFDLLTSLADHDDHDDVLKELGAQMSPPDRTRFNQAMRDFYEEAREAMKHSTLLLPR